MEISELYYLDLQNTLGLSSVFPLQAPDGMTACISPFSPRKAHFSINIWRKYLGEIMTC